MNKIAVLFILLLITGTACRKEVTTTSTCTLNVSDSSALHPKDAVFRDILERYRKKGFPGISVLVEDENGVWTGSAGKADIDKRIDFLPCHVSKVASITKIMVHALTLKLHEEGIVDLDAPISKYLDKEIIEKVKHADKATIKMLMHHQSGIYDLIKDADFYLGVLNKPRYAWKAGELAAFTYNKPAAFEPDGQKSSYSNTNTLLLSMVLDKILGRSHALALREKILSPLDLKNTYYHVHEALPKEVAQGYYDLYNNGTIINLTDYWVGNGNGYNGIYSNVYDLRTFIRALFIDKTILQESSLAMMKDMLKEFDSDNFYIGYGAIGKYFNNEFAIGHTGRDLAYSADMFYFPGKNNRVMVFLINYGTDGKTSLKPVFESFENELANKVLE